jgi:hypothetical protein
MVAVADVVLDQVVEVDYGQLYLTASEADVPVPELAFAGQSNGLCGAAVPGALYLLTGLQHGSVGFAVERHEAEPPLDGQWEDVVEVSFTAPAGQLSLRNADGGDWPVTLPAGDSRVRYCARGMQAGWDTETSGDSRPVDRYLLAFWPSAPEPDCIVRQVSDAAAYWHRTNGAVAAGVPEASEETAQARLAAVRVYLGVVRALHEPLIAALARADDDVHRRVARWAALRALSVTGIDGLPVMQPAVASLTAGSPVPPPFDNEVTVLRDVGAAVPQTTVEPVAGLLTDDDDDELAIPQWNALSAVSGTALADSLEAALNSVTEAAIAHGPDRSSEFLRALLETFSELDR